MCVHDEDGALGIGLGRVTPRIGFHDLLTPARHRSGRRAQCGDPPGRSGRAAARLHPPHARLGRRRKRSTSAGRWVLSATLDILKAIAEGKGPTPLGRGFGLCRLGRRPARAGDAPPRLVRRPRATRPCSTNATSTRAGPTPSRAPASIRGCSRRSSAPPNSLKSCSSLLTLKVETPATNLMRPSSRSRRATCPVDVDKWGSIMSGQLKRRGLFASAALLLCVSMPAQAAMGCWNDNQVAAAKVRDLQSRLMVATLRCQAMGVNVADAYNRFIAANRATIQGANGVILAAVPGRPWRCGADPIRPLRNRARQHLRRRRHQCRNLRRHRGAGRRGGRGGRRHPPAGHDRRPIRRACPAGRPVQPGLRLRRGDAIESHIKISLYLHLGAVAAREPARDRHLFAGGLSYFQETARGDPAQDHRSAIMSSPTSASPASAARRSRSPRPRCPA